MLFLLFQMGKDRYALEASRVVEVVPMLALNQLPQAVRREIFPSSQRIVVL